MNKFTPDETIYYDRILKADVPLKTQYVANAAEHFLKNQGGNSITIHKLLENEFNKAANGRGNAARTDNNTKFMFVNPIQVVGVRGNPILGEQEPVSTGEPVFYDSSGKFFFQIEREYFKPSWWINVNYIPDIGVAHRGRRNAHLYEKGKAFVELNGKKIHVFQWSGIRQIGEIIKDDILPVAGVAVNVGLSGMNTQQQDSELAFATPQAYGAMKTYDTITNIGGKKRKTRKGLKKKTKKQRKGGKKSKRRQKK